MRKLRPIDKIALLVTAVIWAVAIYLLAESSVCYNCPEYPDPSMYSLNGGCNFTVGEDCFANCSFRNTGSKNLTGICLDILYGDEYERHSQELLGPGETMEAVIRLPCRDEYLVYVDSAEHWRLYDRIVEV